MLVKEVTIMMEQILVMGVIKIQLAKK
jgi:hypothetical protein